ncbi:PEP-CTERM sorting domain-containing protein [Pontiellaceae bacterium B1224]|nr:PEP-CTERM sorting domain-containing protein [Pontiellaceae bacterium B1224]
MKKMSRKKWSALALSAAVFCGVTVEADTIATGGSFPTSAEVIAATPDVGDFGDDANDSVAQTFSVSSAFSAQAIYLEYETDANANVDWNMKLTIFEVTDVHATNLVQGAIVYADTFTFPPVGGSDSIAQINLTTPLSLNASAGDSGYGLQITTEDNGGDFNPGFEWLRTTDGTGGDVYAGGEAYESNVLKADRDFVLAISSIPEPATLGLIGVCAIGSLIVRRFKM